MLQLAIATGIPASEWARESAEAIATAMELLNEKSRKD